MLIEHVAQRLITEGLPHSNVSKKWSADGMNNSQYNNGLDLAPLRYHLGIVDRWVTFSKQPSNYLRSKTGTLRKD